MNLVLRTDNENEVVASPNDISEVMALESNNTANQPFCNFPHLTIVDPERNNDGKLSLTAKKSYIKN